MQRLLKIKPEKGSGKYFTREGKNYVTVVKLPNYTACVEVNKKGIPFGEVFKFKNL